MDQFRVLGWIRKFHNLLTTHFLADETFFSLKENGECKKSRQLKSFQDQQLAFGVSTSILQFGAFRLRQNSLWINFSLNSLF